MNFFNDMVNAVKHAVHEIIEGIKRIFNAIFGLARDTPVLEVIEVATMV